MDSGTYAEALNGPPHFFVLKGNVISDSGLDAKPIIDPSTLSNPTSRNCLSVGSWPVLIEGFVFRNGPAMYPRQSQGLTGGVLSFSEALVMRDCLFDSVYLGLRASLGADLDRCRFEDGIWACVDADQGKLIARNCYFKGRCGGWGLVECGDSTLLENCLISDRGVGHALYMVNADHVILRQCLFDQISPRGSSYVLITGNINRVEDCVFRDCVLSNYILDLQSSCATPPTVVNCVFEGNRVPIENAGIRHCVTVSYPEGFSPDCDGALFDSCAFQDGLLDFGSLAISANGPIQVLRSRVRDMAGRDRPAIEFVRGNSIMHENLIYSNNFAVGTIPWFSSTADATHNWWGHESGPYHSWLNPDGQGDEVGDNVDFTPWHTDTLFMTSSPDPRPPLPEQASLLAYPNPFNATTTLQLSLPRAGVARIELFDVTGRKLKELWSGAVGETREIHFDGTDFASGMYFARAWDPLGNRLYAATKVVLLK